MTDYHYSVKINDELKPTLERVAKETGLSEQEALGDLARGAVKQEAERYSVQDRKGKR